MKTDPTSRTLEEKMLRWIWKLDDARDAIRYDHGGTAGGLASIQESMREELRKTKTGRKLLETKRPSPA